MVLVAPIGSREGFGLVVNLPEWIGRNHWMIKEALIRHKIPDCFD